MKNWIIEWLWCLPQNIVGLIVKIATRAKRTGDHYRYNVRSGSVTLGKYVFLCPAHWEDEETLKHEKGHQKQSQMLGWLYLFVIGIPSIIWAGCFEKYRKKHNTNYYDFYTERWANRLGGVNIK